MNDIKHATGIDSKIYHDSVNIRTKVFVEEQNVPKNLEIDDREAECTYFNIYIDNKAVATARIFVTDDNGIHIQRVAVLKDYRQQHLGSELIKAMIDYAKNGHYDYAILGAQDHAQAFYQKLGFEVVGPQYQEVGIAHHDMKLNL